MNILSTGVNTIFSAGTKHPIYANITAKHVCLNKVDLPPMFGPVTKRAREGSFVVLKVVVLGMKILFDFLSLEFFILTPGCYIFVKSKNGLFNIYPSWSISGIIIGRQHLSPLYELAIANDYKQSSSYKTETAGFHRFLFS